MRDDYGTRSSNEFDHHSAITERGNTQKAKHVYNFDEVIERKVHELHIDHFIFGFLHPRRGQTIIYCKILHHLDNRFCDAFGDFAL